MTGCEVSCSSGVGMVVVVVVVGRGRWWWWGNGGDGGGGGGGGGVTEMGVVLMGKEGTWKTTRVGGQMGFKHG